MKKPACFVVKIDPSLAEKMRSDLADQGFEFTTPQYTLFQAQKKGISCTLYTSGKLTIQGKDKDEFIEYYIEPEILKTLTYTYPEIQMNLTARIGIDESGKGDFFGPLCIGGVYADETTIKTLLELGVKDSKQMTDSAARSLSKKIKDLCAHSIVRISPKKYNELYSNFRNLNRLLAWGHATAITELVEKTGCHEVIIDQFASEHIVKQAVEKKKIEVHLVQRHRAEEDPVVAAASILSRAAFLEGLENLSREIGYTLPKGASKLVLEAGKKLVDKHGSEVLNGIAKLHFKTTGEILGAQTPPSE